MIRKTATITAASIAGIILAGGAAVGANIGILNSSEDDTLGQLSAELQPAPESTSTSPDTSPSVERFTVDAAGTVAVRHVGDAIEVENVSPNTGWSWDDVSDSDTVIQLTFRHAASGEVLDFVARTDEAGVVTARVERRSTTPPTTPATTPATLGTAPGTTAGPDANRYDDDRDDDAGYDDRDDDDHEREEHEHEGWDSDD